MASLRIAEAFASIQGEGLWIGTPSWFIRVSGCPLRCRWCDTPYASWQPEGPVRSVEDIAQEALDSGLRHVVLTGGEPMAFAAVGGLTKVLHEAGRIITIETAGVHWQDVSCSLMSLSPKLSHSAPDEAPGGWRARHEALRLDRAPLRRLAEAYDCQLKLVVNPEASDMIEEVQSLLRELPDFPPDRVCLMAEGREAALLHQRERILVPLCLAQGWRLTPRYHIDLFGDTRGT